MCALKHLVQFSDIFGWGCFPLPCLLVYLFIFVIISQSYLLESSFSNFMDLKCCLLLQVNCQKQTD